MQSLKQILGLIIVALALYGAYALFVSKKPANDSVSQEFIDELVKEGFGDIQYSQGAEGKSALFSTLTGAPPLPNGRGSDSSLSSIPASLLNFDDIDDFEDDPNAPNLQSTAPLYGNYVENSNEEHDHSDDAPLLEVPTLDDAPAFETPAPDWDDAPIFDPNASLPNQTDNNVCTNCTVCVDEKKTIDENLFGDGPYSLTVPFSKKISPNGVLPDEKLISTSEVYAQNLITSNTLEDFSSVPTETVSVPPFSEELPLFGDSKEPNLTAFDLPPLDAPQETQTDLPGFETITPTPEIPVLEQVTEQFAEGVTGQIADTLASGLERFDELDKSPNELSADNDLLLKMLPKVVRPLPPSREAVHPLPAAMSLASGTVPVNRVPNELAVPVEQPVIEETPPDVPAPIAPEHAANVGAFNNIAESIIPLQQETEAATQELSFSDFESQTPKAPTLPGVATSSKKKTLPGLDTVFPLENPVSEEDVTLPSIEDMPEPDFASDPVILEPISDLYHDATDSEPVLNSFPLANEPSQAEPVAVNTMNLPTAPSPDLLSSAAPHVPGEEPVLNATEEFQPIVSPEMVAPETIVQEEHTIQPPQSGPQGVPETLTIRPEIAERLARIRPILATGNYRTGHRQATVLYMANLNTAEKEAVLPVVNQCGWEAFFARRYDPYSFMRPVSDPNTAPEEILQSFSKQYHVSPELIFKINGIQNVKDLASKKDLKVPPGPFDAVILISRKELVVTAHGLYACRFRIGIGKPELITETEYQIEVINGEVQKYKNPRYIHEDGEIGPGDPRNPLGTHWIGLDQAIGLHGTNDPKCIGTDNAAVEGFSLDNRDIAEVYDMLSTESKIVIRP